MPSTSFPPLRARRLPGLLAMSLATLALSSQAATGPASAAVAKVSLPATPTWVSVANKGLALKTGLLTGNASAAQPVHIAVSLNLQDLQGLQSFVKNSHTRGNLLYGQVLTSAQFNARYAPTVAQAQAVTSYLASQGFTNIKVAGNNAVISADGTAGIAQTAFNTHIVAFTWQGKSLYVNNTDVQVPSALNGIVLSVAGINNIQAVHLHNHPSPSVHQDLFPSRTVASATKARAGTTQPKGLMMVTPKAGAATTHSGYTGPDYEVSYDANSVTPAYATTIAIVSAGTDLLNVIPQLRLAERVNGQPVVPTKIIQVAPVPATQTPDNDGEWDLDSQASTGIAENLNQLLFYNTTSLDDADLILATNQFAVDNVAQIGNMSYGGCEAEEIAPLGDIGGTEQTFIQAVAQGQTWFASTGDTGSTCGSPVNTGYPTGVPDPEYPATSPNVVAAGGTTLSSDASFNYVSEAAWIGGGSGTSEVFASPSWQVASGVAPAATVTGAVGTLPTGTATGVPDSEAGAGRATADVSMAADPASGLSTYVLGEAETIGGTSLASPLSAGSYARLQSAHCNTLGFGSPQFYALDTTTGLMSTAKGFNDITLGGTDGTYVTTTGWDDPTGFGSFDIAAVNAALPATTCTLNHKPVAVLSADTTGGTGPLNVTLNGTKSSDPDNDSIVQYVVDYGDNTNLVIQTTPVFPTHDYALPGNYLATLSVRDSAGNASLPVTLPITVYGIPQGCTLPGETLITSPAGVADAEMGIDLAAEQDDLLNTYFAEPANLVNKLVVTIKVNNLTGGPMPAFRWVTYFNIPENSNNYYVDMDTSTGTPTYDYGIHTSLATPAASLTTYMPLGTLDAASNNNPDGTITLILDKSAIGLKTGDVLSGIVTSVRTSSPNDPTGTQPLGVGLTQDTGAATQTYTIVGNDVCAQDIANPPTGPTTGGGTTTPTSGGTTTPTSGGTTTPTSGGTTMPTSGTTPTPTSGGTTPTPTSTPTASSPPDTGLSPVVVTPTESTASNNVGRGGAGALGWLVLLPLSAGALRRRKVKAKAPPAA